MHILASVILLLVPSAALADKAAIKVVETTIYSEAETFEGYKYRADVTSATLLSQKSDVAGAWRALEPALTYCDGKKSTNVTTYASVSNQLEMSEFLKSKDHSPSVVFIDMACPSAFKMAAFLSVGAGDSKKAFSFLDRAQAIAPFWAEPYTERAYLLRVLGDNDNALLFYRKALNLANSHKSSANVRAMSYRGIGFVLTEKGDLNSAREAYEASLLIEPENQLAKDEIIYIDKLQVAKH